jgi:hypothetical protein
VKPQRPTISSGEYLDGIAPPVGGGGGGVSWLVLKLGRLKPLQPANIRPPASALRVTGASDF